MYYVPGLDRKRPEIPMWLLGPLVVILLPILLPIAPLHLLTVGAVNRRRKIRAWSWLGAAVLVSAVTLWLVGRCGAHRAGWFEAVVGLTIFAFASEMLKSLKVYWGEFQHERRRPPMWYR